MAKNKTEIHVTTVFDGELDATDVFVSLISQKYGKTNSKIKAGPAGGIAGSSQFSLITTKTTEK